MASTFIIFLSLVLLTYDFLGVRTVVDVFIIPTFVINVALIFRTFKNKEAVIAKSEFK
ncbi:hypothetical protein [Gelidibacter sp.]|uniref:hypothetical protein n=1 Tax=Gelidibacter sp. TaxID=2018083 RepID=UPI002D80B249|nr:hypothetical protein [Gelidibacter sp.]